ncbi:MAG: hypothetical protein AAF799_01045 [Myxococcota bacterium]
MFHIETLIDALCPVRARDQLDLRNTIPLRSLRRSRADNPVLASRRERLDELDARLAPAIISARWWANPEVHAPLMALGDRCSNERDVDRQLQRLAIVTGEVPVDAPGNEDGIYRLEHLGQGVVERRDGVVLPRLATWWHPDGTMVYLPLPGLFADLPFPPDYAPDHPAGNSQVAIERYQAAREWLDRVAPMVSADFRRVISGVALLPPVPGAQVPPTQAQWSFNLRLRFRGVLFVNPFSVGLAALAEALLHEYLHQRMWLWWELSEPTGLPLKRERMCSPVSGHSRPVITMIQGLMIFRCVATLHERLLDLDEPDAVERAWSAQRLDQLRHAVPRLAEALRAQVPEASGARRIVDMIHRDFERERTGQVTGAA